MTFHLRTAGVSVLGGRETNQDSFHAGERLIAIADGVGGGPAGDVASQLAVAAVAGLGPDADPADSAAAANTAVLTRAAENAELLGMATTLDSAALTGDQVHGAHVGDSIALLRHGGELIRLTRPHNLASELIAAGHLDPESGKRHPQGRALVRALGLDTSVRADVWARPATPGDRYLLATDGLPDALGEQGLAAAIAATADLNPQQCAAELVRLAEVANAHDNVTVVIADVIWVD